MQIKSLFKIVLKILGLFFVKEVLTTAPQIMQITLFFRSGDDTIGAIWSIGVTCLILLIYATFAFYLIIRTQTIVSWLRLDQDFEYETVQFDMHRSTVLSIAVIVVGGLVLVEEIPELCRHLFQYFQDKRYSYGQDVTLTYSVVAGVKVAIGFLLVYHQRQIVNFIELSRKKFE